MSDSRNVLLVEDEQGVREVLEELLQGAGYAVSTATNGAEALALLDANRFDIVLLDAVIPGGSGMEVADRAVLLRTPVIITSGHPDRIEKLTDGEHAFLSKPFHTCDLLALMSELLNREPSLVDLAGGVESERKASGGGLAASNF
jgi:DNA-binding response OmpR family regulator